MPGKAQVQSVLRALEILERVGQSEEGLTLTQLARQVKLNPTTAHNLARTLAGAGYLYKAGRGAKYQLGSRIEELSQMQRRRNLLAGARETLLELADRMPEATLTFSEAVGREVVARLRVSPERPDTCQEPGHQVMAPYTSATSLAFQAFWRDQQRRAYLRSYPFEEYATAHWDSPEQLDAFLAKARGRGAIVLSDRYSKGLRVAVPVMSAGHELLAVLGLALGPEAAPQDDREEQAFLETMTAAAQALGRARGTQRQETLTC
jgi:DNA-binding IclR family transcriptional regulator